jgi:hypothetical protein
MKTSFESGLHENDSDIFMSKKGSLLAYGFSEWFRRNGLCIPIRSNETKRYTSCRW